MRIHTQIMIKLKRQFDWIVLGFDRIFATYDYKGGISQHPGDEPVNEPVNEPVKLVYSAVCRNPGIRIPAIVANVGKNTAAVKRAISQLKKLGKVEFRGAPKTGGYYPIEKA